MPGARPVGTLITVDHLKTVQWPASSAVAGSFSSTEELTDRGLIASVITNEPMTETKLAPREAGAGLPPSIPLGMRAISVRVNDVIGVAGFVVPGTASTCWLPSVKVSAIQCPRSSSATSRS